MIRDSILLGSNQNQDVFYGYNAFNSNNLSNLAIWGNGTAIHLDNSSVANKFDHIDVESSGLPFQVQSSNNTITGSYFEANGNCPSWSATTSYSLGACIIDSNNNMEVAVIPGTSGSSGPSWPSALQNFDPRLVPTKTADGTVVWKSAMRVTGVMLSGPNAVLNNVIGGYGSAGGNPVAVQDDSWGFNNTLGAASSACFNVYNCLDGLQSHGFLTGDASAAFLGGIWAVPVSLPAPTATVPYSGGSTTVTYALNATLGDTTRGAYSQTGLSSFAGVTNSVPRSQLGQVYAANVSHGQGTNYTIAPQCGSGYATGNTLTTTPNTGSLETGTGVVLTVTSVSAGGCVTGLSVTTVGGGYQPQFGVGTSAITGSGSGLLVDIYSYANKIYFPWYINVTSLGGTWPVRANSWLWDVAVNSSSQSLVTRFSGATTTGGDISGDNTGYVWDYGQSLSGYAAPSRNNTGDGYVAGKLSTTHNTLDDGSGNATVSGNATLGGTVTTPHNTLEDGSGNMNAAGKLTAQQFCVGANCVSSLWSNPMTVLGDLLFGSTSGAAARLAGNSTTTPMYLKSLGSGGSAAAPTLAQIQFADIAGTLGINAGGTGQSTASAAFNALSPLTTEGDLHYYHSSTNARLSVGSNGQCLISNGTDPTYGPCLVPSGSPSQYQTAVFSSPTFQSGVGPGSAGQILTSAGASANPAYSDFPNIVMPVQAATCSAGTGAPKWSYPSSGAPTAACRTGSNVNMGVLQFAQSNSAQFQLDIPGDWDSSSTVYAKVYLTQGSNTTSGQTIVMQIATGCSSTTDDPPFTTAQSFGTATTTGTAYTPFLVTLSGLSMTNCVPGGNVNVKISRSSSDTATTPPSIVWAAFTFQRLLAAAAN